MNKDLFTKPITTQILAVGIFAVGLCAAGLWSTPSVAQIGQESTTTQITAQSRLYDPGRDKWLPLARSVQVGVRPYFLVDDLDTGPLRMDLRRCAKKTETFSSSDFSIGHGGAPLQFPEHTAESYVAAARQGAGFVSCDVTFTSDRELVCRTNQCDLHTTTNILKIPELAEKCSNPFLPANPLTGTPASAKCCASDITLAEFKTLCGKMNSSDITATTVDGYLGGTPPVRTELYANCATVLSHKDSIDLLARLDVKHMPQLTTPVVSMPFDGDFTSDLYAQQMIDDYKEAEIAPKNVRPQSFNLSDIDYWIANEPEFASQVVYLDSRPYTNPNFRPDFGDMQALVDRGVKTIAPPMFALLDLNSGGHMTPSLYAIAARTAGLDLITWTVERSGYLNDGGGFFYQSVNEVINNDADVFKALNVLAGPVGVLGVFSDWPATTTFFANCLGL